MLILYESMGPGLDQARDPGSAVRQTSVKRCLSDCRSRGREFDPDPIPYDPGQNPTDLDLTRIIRVDLYRGKG